MLYLLLVFLMFVVMLLYFRIADHYNIIDHPNERSSHSKVTIRGGGIIFLFSAICLLFLQSENWIFIIGLLIIGTISFIDDRVTLSNKIRIIVHLVSVTLLFYSINVFQIFPWYVYILLYIFVIGIINAYNFMDGINGITGTYSFIIFSGLQYVNLFQHSFVEPDLIWLPMLACIVFLFFNFRKRAKCFAGDVGSISIAFWIVFLLFKVILKTGNYTYILFLAVYGVDAILTILHRILLKQNIFEAHRLHFYQILANDQKWDHIWVSLIYSCIQLVIVVSVMLIPIRFDLMFLLTIVPLCLVYVFFKAKLMLR